MSLHHLSVLSQGLPPVPLGQHGPGCPLQLQQVLDCHLCEEVAGVQLHDQPDHDGDEHGGGVDGVQC